MNKIEVRNMDISMNTNDNDMMVDGIVNVPNQRSQLLMDRRGRKFYEEIEQGAFQNAINEADEILFLADHNKKHILASTKNNSLLLEETEQGVYMTANIVDTSYGQDAYKLIKSGLISNMSFGFVVLEDKWSKTENGTPLRTVTKMALKEVSSVKNPAYTQSSISARSLDYDVDVPFDKEVNNVVEIRDIHGEVEGRIELREKDNEPEAFELFFFNEIGNASWDKYFSECTIPQDVIDLLEPIKSAKVVDIHINSGGGSVFGGYAIYNLLRNVEAKKRCIVDGLAGSIASVIAFAGDEIVMPSNSILMIHKPTCGVRGNADDLAKQIEVLNTVQRGLVEVYMTKAKEGVTREQINDLINAETYMTGVEASKYFDITVQNACKKKKECRSFDLDHIKDVFNIADEVEEPRNEIEVLSEEINAELEKLNAMLKEDIENE